MNWTEVGQTYLPERKREAALATIARLPWRAPDDLGWPLPFSQGFALRTLLALHRDTVRVGWQDQLPLCCVEIETEDDGAHSVEVYGLELPGGERLIYIDTGCTLTPILAIGLAQAA